jgi:hypothetical protein
LTRDCKKFDGKWNMKSALVGIAAALLIAGCSSSKADQLTATDGSAKSSVVSTPPDSGTSSSDATSSTEASTTTAAPTTTVASAPDHTDIEIVSKGFTQLPREKYSDTDYVSYAVVLKNPNGTRWVPNSVSVNITLLDSSGTVVKSDSPSPGMMLPGAEVAVGDSVQAAGVASMEVQVLASRWTDAGDSQLGSFTAQGVTYNKQQYGGDKVTGKLTSTFAKDLKQIKAVAVAYDSAGHVLAGADSYVDFVPAKGSVGFEISSLNSFPSTVAKVDVLAAPSNLTVLEAGD